METIALIIGYTVMVVGGICLTGLLLSLPYLIGCWTMDCLRKIPTIAAIYKMMWPEICKAIRGYATDRKKD